MRADNLPRPLTRLCFINPEFLSGVFRAGEVSDNPPVPRLGAVGFYLDETKALMVNTDKIKSPPEVLGSKANVGFFFHQPAVFFKNRTRDVFHAVALGGFVDLFLSALHGLRIYELIRIYK